MNKRCTNPACRRMFSTVEFGGQCPHCGKVYQQLGPVPVSLQVVGYDDQNYLKIKAIKCVRQYFTTRKLTTPGLTEAKEFIEGNRPLQMPSRETAKDIMTGLKKFGVNAEDVRNLDNIRKSPVKGQPSAEKPSGQRPTEKVTAQKQLSEKAPSVKQPKQPQVEPVAQKRTPNKQHTPKDGKTAPTPVPGMKLDGVVRNVVSYGAFIGYGPGNDDCGLLHRSQYPRAWRGSGCGPCVGDKVTVRVLEADMERHRIDFAFVPVPRIISSGPSDTDPVGDIVIFGTYKQDNTANGVKPIEWLVLDKTDNGVLLISRYALDAKPYYAEYTDVTWETCSLRTWLNRDFYKTAFSSAERALIATTKVTAGRNPHYDTNPGKNTQDKVFLLSIREANKYFANNTARQCKPTSYAVANKVEMTSWNCWWWLRSPGSTGDCAAFVYSDGSVLANGDDVHCSGFAVRPALWVRL